jgi:YidC/Oxa1 family membrane protein insertase
MELYRNEGVNPLGGCFPILIQMPFLIGMFDLLKSTFELRGAVFVPGWIDNLTSPDVLFSWDYPIFFIGSEFHLLPLLLGGVMWLQGWVNRPTPAPGEELTDQQKQQQSMGTMMALMFTIMFYRFPSGLCLYWLSSMLLGILQQWVINKQIDSSTSSEPALVTAGASRKAKKGSRK